MAKYECNVCGFVYDEAEEGTTWENLDADYACPLCMVGRDEFSIVEE